MANLKIPISPGVPSTRQRAVLDGREFILDLRWSTREERWYLDVRDSNGDPLALSIGVVTNWPLLYRFRQHSSDNDLMIPDGELWFVAGHPDHEYPTLESMGDTVVFVYQESE